MTNEEKWVRVLVKCGFKEIDDIKQGYHWEMGKRVKNWCEPDGTQTFEYSRRGYLPPLTLDNLFKCVVPMLPKEWRNWKSVLHDWVEGLTGDYKKDAIALLNAIYEVLK